MGVSSPDFRVFKLCMVIDLRKICILNNIFALCKHHGGHVNVYFNFWFETNELLELCT